MKLVRYSIVITCYNQRDFIRDAVNSALAQGDDDTEVIVVDDASSDGSCEVLKEYGDRITFRQMDRNGGPSRSRNVGASMANGQYLVFLDGDDALMPHALNIYNTIIERRRPMLVLAAISQFSGLVPQARLEEAANGPLKFVEYSCAMSKDRPAFLSSSATVVDREAFLAVGGWTPDIFHGDNKDMMMKLGYAGSLVLILEPKTVFYRVHAGNSINDISSFLKSGHRLIANERSGHYPGGRARAFERYAALGVFVFFWSMKGLTVGLWTDVAKLTVAGFPMVLAGAVQRCVIRLKGLQPVESIEGLESRRSSNHG